MTMIRLLVLLIFFLCASFLWIELFGYIVSTTTTGITTNKIRQKQLGHELNNLDQLVQQIEKSNAKDIDRYKQAITQHNAGPIKEHMLIGNSALKQKSTIIENLNKRQSVVYKQYLDVDNRTFWSYIPPWPLIILSCISTFMLTIVAKIAERFTNYIISNLQVSIFMNYIRNIRDKIWSNSM